MTNLLYHNYCKELTEKARMPNYNNTKTKGRASSREKYGRKEEEKVKEEVIVEEQERQKVKWESKR